MFKFNDCIGVPEIDVKLAQDNGLIWQWDLSARIKPKQACGYIIAHTGKQWERQDMGLGTSFDLGQAYHVIYARTNGYWQSYKKIRATDPHAEAKINEYTRPDDYTLMAYFDEVQKSGVDSLDLLHLLDSDHEDHLFEVRIVESYDPRIPGPCWDTWRPHDDSTPASDPDTAPPQIARYLNAHRAPFSIVEGRAGTHYCPDFDSVTHMAREMGMEPPEPPLKWHAITRLITVPIPLEGEILANKIKYLAARRYRTHKMRAESG